MAMTRPERAQHTSEAVGIFATAERLSHAGEVLVAEGFARDAIGVLARRDATERALEMPESTSNATRVHGARADAQTPRIEQESIGGATHAWLGGLSLAGTTTLGAVAVASAAVLGGAFVAAAAGAATVGAVGVAMSAIIHERDADYLEEHIDAGHLLLFVRTRGPAEQQRALELMRANGALEAKPISASGGGG